MTRKRYRPRPVVANPIALAMHRAGKLAPDERQDLMHPAADAFALLKTGAGTVEAWQQIADALNLSEALVELRIGTNLSRMADDSQLALAALMQRVQSTGSWTLRAAEIVAIEDGLWLYGVQLRECSAGEYLRAVDIVRERISQALAGNAGARAVVHAGAAA